MAATKKAAAAALRNLDLTRAKDDDGGKLRVEGAVVKRLARAYLEAHEEIEALEQEQKARKQRIIEAVAEKRLAAEQEGRFYATAQIEVEDDESLQILWTDRYKLLDASHEPLLKRAFGQHYDELFRETMDAKVEDDATLDDMKAALGADAFAALQKFLRVSSSLKLKKGFMATRANLRESFDETTNESIDTVIGKVAYAPTLKPVRPK
jgi:hypothetical protein